jgi:hypothetical protein
MIANFQKDTERRQGTQRPQKRPLSILNAQQDMTAAMLSDAGGMKGELANG